MKVAYLTNNVPAYRTDFISRCFADKRLEVTVFCHKDIHGHTVKLIPEHLRHRLVLCDTLTLFGGAFIFEKLPIKSLLTSYDVIISDGNPRHVGYALLATLAAIMRRRVIIWSTLHSRRNRRLTQWLRLRWWKIFMEFFSYTEPDAANLRAQFPGRIVHSTNNGLDQVSIDRAKCSYPLASLTAFKSKLGLEGKRIALSLGRALPGRFNLMVPVLREMKRRDADFRWILLGDGDGIATLKAELKSFGVSDLAILVGAVYGEAELAKWFGIADLFVYPDAIGLSLYHAYGYGLPVIVHSNYAFHGPEMGTFKEGLTGLTFEPGNASHMAEQIVRLLNDDGRRNKMNTHVLEIVHNLYNSEIMFERFTRALLEPVSVL